MDSKLLFQCYNLFPLRDHLDYIKYDVTYPYFPGETDYGDKIAKSMPKRVFAKGYWNWGYHIIDSDSGFQERLLRTAEVCSDWDFPTVAVNTIDKIGLDYHLLQCVDEELLLKINQSAYRSNDCERFWGRSIDHDWSGDISRGMWNEDWGYALYNICDIYPRAEMCSDSKKDYSDIEIIGFEEKEDPLIKQLPDLPDVPVSPVVNDELLGKINNVEDDHSKDRNVPIQPEEQQFEVPVQGHTAVPLYVLQQLQQATRRLLSRMY